MPLYRVYSAGTEGFAHTECFDLTPEPVEAVSPEDAIDTVLRKEHGNDDRAIASDGEVGVHYRAYPVQNECERVPVIVLRKPA